MVESKIIQSSAGSLLTIYHQGAISGQETENRAILICPPFGQEAIRSYKCLSLLANRLAHQGVHVMRLAYRGTGDSSLWSDEITTLADWISDIKQAKEELQRVSGCETVGLLGLRLGANFAVQVARESEDVHSLVLWQPVEDGAGYLAALRGMQAEMLDLWHCYVQTQDTAETEELLATRYQRSLLAEIENLQFELEGVQQPALVCLADSVRRQPDRQQEETTQRYDIVREGMEKRIYTSDPQDWEVLNDLEVVWWRPSTVQKLVTEIDEIFNRLSQAGWFQHATAEKTTASVAIEKIAIAPQSNFSNFSNFDHGQSLNLLDDLPSAAILDQEEVWDIQETVHQFGQQAKLTGVLTQPPLASRVPDSPVVVMLNAGIVHRVGPFRLHVDMARSLAQCGFTSLRIDLSGLGDSSPRTGKLTKDERVRCDFEDAADFLHRQGLANRFVVLGLCSGAYHAHQIALQNPQCVGGVFLDGIVFPTWGFYFRHHFLRLFSGRFWRNAIKRRWRNWAKNHSNQANLEGQRLAEAEYFQVSKSRKEVADEIAAMKQRLLQMLFVYTGGYEHICGKSQFREMWGIQPDEQIQVEYLAQSEHTFRIAAHREQVCRLVAEWMQKRFPGQDSG